MLPVLLTWQTPQSNPKQEREEDTNKQWLRKRDKKLKFKDILFLYFRSVKFLPAVEFGSFLNVTGVCYFIYNGLTKDDL